MHRRVLNRAIQIAVMLVLAGSSSWLSADQAHADLASTQIPGFDISWPQCGHQYPFGPVAFAIVGINNGRPYTANPCFMDQYKWAQRLEKTPAVYVNVEYPKPGRPEALVASPLYSTCKDDDLWCQAYNFGYGISREVTTRAAALRVTPSMWWLDVETGNYWSDDPTYNFQVVRGALDFFKERKLAVGVYSTPRQWGIIAGTNKHNVPVWTAGAQGIDDAASRCGNGAYAFGGGNVTMVQYYDFGFDTNFACPAGHPLSRFPLPDTLGRTGPYGRSLGAAGQNLPFWRSMPMVSGGT